MKKVNNIEEIEDDREKGKNLIIKRLYIYKDGKGDMRESVNHLLKEIAINAKIHNVK